MRSIVFSSEEALRVAMTSGLVPGEVVAGAAQVMRVADGGVVMATDSTLSRAALQTLTAAGVQVTGAAPAADARSVRCWAEALAPRRDKDPEPRAGVVLFVVPQGRALLDLAAEMLRLGCDRQEYRFLAGTGGNGAGSGANGAATIGLLRVANPPYYTVVRALDARDGVRAYVPSPPGQELVWTEVGWQHPLVNLVRAPQGQVLLIPRTGDWGALAEGRWADVYQLLDLQVPAATAAYAPADAPARLTVPLRITRASRVEAPSLWVLREGGVAQVDRLLQNLPEEVAGRLLYAVGTSHGGDGKTQIVVLRARLGRQAPPDLAVAGEAYAPLLSIGNLFVPADAIVEPPLRRDKLRELLAPSADRITWLAPTGGGGFRPETLPDAAFAPLADWVDYLVHTAADDLAPWARAATFDFGAFESIGAEWAAGPPPERQDAADRRPKQRRSKEREAVADPDADADAAPAEPDPTTTRSRRRGAKDTAAAGGTPEAAPVVNPDEETLAAVEQEFLALDAPADDPARAELWDRMAELNTSLGRRRDAGLSWTRLVWELSGDAETTAATRWAAAEARLAGAKDGAAAVTRLLAQTTPAREDTRAVAAQIALAPASLAKDAHKIQLWLDDHDETLDVRSLWLSRFALARLAGGDPLGLARTRDRILARLARGLSVERDVPTFLRFGSSPAAGAAGAGAPAEGRTAGGALRLAQELEELYVRFDKTRRQRALLEAPVELTRAYVMLTLGYGLARLGQADRARTLRQGAVDLVDAKDPVHGFLTRAYGVRIDQALEGLPPETPLPAEVAGELNALEKLLRYKVDRLRQTSTILEPQERLDPVQGFIKNEKDLRGEEFAAMRAIADPVALAEEAEKLYKRAVKRTTDVEERARLFDGLMDFFPLLPEAQAIPMLEELVEKIADVEPPRRAVLLEEALTVAGHFGRSELVKTMVASLEELLGSLGAKHAAEVARVLGACLRSLRRVGLREEAAELLAAMTAITAGAGTPALLARLQLAAGLAYLGRLDRAEPIFVEAQEALANDKLLMPDRLLITRALAGALGQTPIDHAVKALAKLVPQLAQITDQYATTSTHFCLSVVNFTESLVLGYVSEDLALGEIGRRWLDEDEYLVRRRIHRDLALGTAATTQKGKRR